MRFKLFSFLLLTIVFSSTAIAQGDRSDIGNLVGSFEDLLQEGSDSEPRADEESDSDDSRSQVDSEVSAEEATGVLGGAVDEFLAPLDSSGIDIEAVTPEMTENALKEVTSTPLDSVINSEVIIDSRMVSLLLLFNSTEAFKAKTHQILEKAYSAGDLKNIRIRFNASPVPKVKARRVDRNVQRQSDLKVLESSLRRGGVLSGSNSDTALELNKRQQIRQLKEELKKFLIKGPGENEHKPRYEPDYIYEIDVSAGIMAFMESEDQYAAVLYLALAMENPATFGALRDQRILSFLDSLQSYKSKAKAEQDVLRSSVSVMERLANAGYQPMALARIETDIYDWIRDNVVRKRGYAAGRMVLPKDIDGILSDPTRALRIEIMNAFNNQYLRVERDMSQVKSREFGPEMKAFIRANKIYVKPIYSRWLTYGSPVVLTGGAGAGVTSVVLGAETVFGAVVSAVSTGAGAVGTFITASAGTIGEVVSITGVLEAGGTAVSTGGYVLAATAGAGILTFLWKSRDSIIDRLTSVRMPRLRSTRSSAQNRISHRPTENSSMGGSSGETIEGRGAEEGENLSLPARVEGPTLGQRIGHSLVTTRRATVQSSLTIASYIGKAGSATVLGIGAFGIGGYKLSVKTQRAVRVGLWNSTVWTGQTMLGGYKLGEALVIGTGRLGKSYAVALVDAGEKRVQSLRQRMDRMSQASIEKKYMKNLISSDKPNPLELSNLILTTRNLLTGQNSGSSPNLLPAPETDSENLGETGTSLVPVSQENTQLAELSHTRFSESSLVSFYIQLIEKLTTLIGSNDNLSSEDVLNILRRAKLDTNSHQSILDRPIYQQRIIDLHRVVSRKFPELLEDGEAPLPIFREAKKLKALYEAKERRDIAAYVELRPYLIHMSLKATKTNFDNELYEDIVHEALKSDLDSGYRMSVSMLARELIEEAVGRGRFSGFRFKSNLASFLSRDEMVTLLLNNHMYDSTMSLRSERLRTNLAQSLLRQEGSYSAVQNYLTQKIEPRGVSISTLLTDVTRVNSTDRLKDFEDLNTFLSLRGDRSYSGIPLSVRKQIVRIALENSDKIESEQLEQISNSLSIEVEGHNADNTQVDVAYSELLKAYYDRFGDRFAGSDHLVVSSIVNLERVSGNRLAFLMNSILASEARVDDQIIEHLKNLDKLRATAVLKKALALKGDQFFKYITDIDTEDSKRMSALEQYTRWYATNLNRRGIPNYLITSRQMRASYQGLNFPERFAFFTLTERLWSQIISRQTGTPSRWINPFGKKEAIIRSYVNSLFSENGNLIQALEIHESEFASRSVQLNRYLKDIVWFIEANPNRIPTRENIDAYYSIISDQGTRIDSDMGQSILRAVLKSLLSSSNPWIRDTFSERNIEDVKSGLEQIDYYFTVISPNLLLDKAEGRVLMRELYERLLKEAYGTDEREILDLVQSYDKRSFKIFRTATKIQILKDKFDPAQFIEVMIHLKDLERKSLMVELFNLHGSQFSKFIFSSQAESIQRSQFFEIITSLVDSTSISHQGVEEVITKGLSGEQRATWSSLRDAYGFKDAKPPWWAIFGLESDDRKTEREIIKALKFHNSVSDVVAYTEVLKQRGARLSHFAETFHNLIIVKPELFKSYEDILLFLERDSFWPKMNTSSWDMNRFPLEAPLAELIEKKQARARIPDSGVNPGSWMYKPAFSERAQNVLIRRLEEASLYPQEFESKKHLWIALTNRGVTTVSDRILNELKDEAPSAGQRDSLLTMAVEEDRIFDKASKESWAISKVIKSSSFMALIPEGTVFERFMGGDRGVLEALTAQAMQMTSNLDERMNHIKSVVEFLQSLLPERGIAYEEFLESFSVAINSNEIESAYINEEKFPIADRTRTTEEYVDDALEGGKDASSTSDKEIQAFYKITESIRNWSEEEQYQFIKYIRGERDEPTEFLAGHFPNVGAERLRYIYQELPQQYKVGIMSMFMRVTFVRYSSTDVTRGMPKRIIDDIVGTGNDPATVVTRALLMAGFVALKEADMQDNVAFIFGQILALEKGRKGSLGETLRIVLQHGFRALGDKIAQQIVALGILGEEDTIELQKSQDEVGISDREDSYKELRRILVEDGPFDSLPFELQDTVGGASMKWATRALMTSAEALAILKIKRRHAMFDTRNRFRVLDYMVNYLIDNYGVEFTILRPIIEGAMRGVEREGDFELEASNSKRAKEFIYINLDDPRSVVYVPDEQVMPGSDGNIMVSQFAEGTSFKKVPSGLKPVVARKLLEMEGGILFADADEITFDPDRHGGNYRIWVKEGSNEILLEPIEYGIIDHGQHITMTREQRQKVFDLMALSGIYYASGPNAWWDTKVAEIFNMDSVTKKRFEKLIRKYLAGKKLPKDLAYHQLISAVYMSGYDPKEVKKNNGTNGLQSSIEFSDIYLDLPRAVLQMRQYEAFAPQGVKSPRDLLVEAAKQSGSRYLDEYIEHHRTQVGMYNLAGRAKSLFSDSNFVPLREGMDLNELEELSYQINDSIFSSDASEAATLRPAMVATSCEDLFYDWRPAIQRQTNE